MGSTATVKSAVAVTAVVCSPNGVRTGDQVGSGRFVLGSAGRIRTLSNGAQNAC